jgi:translation initiation factor 2 subunit 1
MAAGEYPEEGEHVVATVQSLRNFGAFVTLDEYDGKEAFIHLSEVATGWVKYIRDYVHEGQKIVARVIHVDLEKGQVDLSLKRINDHQRREKLLEWKNEKRALKLLSQVAQLLGITIEEATSTIGDQMVEKYGSLYKAFEVASLDPKKFTKDAGKDPWVSQVSKVARESINPPHVAVSGILEVSHPASDGVLHVQRALLAAEAVAPESIAVQYVGAPRYRLTVSGIQYKSAEELLKKASDVALSAIKKSGGKGSFIHK